MQILEFQFGIGKNNSNSNNFVIIYFDKNCHYKSGGTVVKNPPANAGDMGSIPGPGKSHMPWSN